MKDVKYISIFPYNGDQYLRNIAFDIKKNKGPEALIFSTLKHYLKERSIEIDTYDIAKKTLLFKCVYFDIPYLWNFKAWKMIFLNKDKNILICHESALVIPFNYWKILHLFFVKVYTWYDPFVDNRKYFKRHWPKSSSGIKTKPKSFSKKKFLIIINKNILPFFPFKLLNFFGKELYTERIKAVEFFERTIPDKFYLYGRGWNKPKKLNLTEHIFGYKKHKAYKGEIGDKIELLSNFKFSLCFENLSDVNGYITEKIFDCLKAKCVPIYYGATDIENYIPKDCFIDFRNFSDYEELLNFLNSIDEKTYDKYIEKIEKLLSGKKFIDMWFENGFAKFFLEDILEIKEYWNKPINQS